MTKTQLATLNETITKIANDIRSSKLEQMRKLIDDQNYVYIDEKRQRIYHERLAGLVERLAARIAQKTGEPVKESHRVQAKNTPKRYSINPYTGTERTRWCRFF